MKILITADCHLGAPMTSSLNREKSAVRDAELYETFRRMISDGVGRGARAVIIAGDLFDKDSISPRAGAFVREVMESHPDTDFLYVAGNHEKTAFFDHGYSKNIKIFGDGWTFFDIDDVRFIGRCDTENLTFSDAPTESSKKNVVILHGSWDNEIRLKDALGYSISLLALGHYHSFMKKSLGEGVALYPGTPEGHGFDDDGEKGYVLYDTEDSSVEFIHVAKRRYFDLDVDVSGLCSVMAVGEKIEKALSDAKPCDLVKIHLVGNAQGSSFIDTSRIEARFCDTFFAFLLVDETKLTMKIEDYQFDKSLRGEFIREVLADAELTDLQRKEILELGLSLLEEGVR